MLLDQFGPRPPRPDGDDRAEVLPLQEATARSGAVVRHHRRVTAVEPDGAGVLVRSAAGAVVRAGVAVVAAGAWAVDVLAGDVVVEQVGSVVLASGTGGTAAVGRVRRAVPGRHRHRLPACEPLRHGPPPPTDSDDPARINEDRDAVDPGGPDPVTAGLADLLRARTLAGTALAHRPHVAVIDELTGQLLALTDAIGLRAGSTLRPPAPTDACTPTAELTRHVQLRDRRCRFPGCRRPGRRCDLHHLVRWPLGDTSAEDLCCLCRHHHRLVHQAPGWQLHALPDGCLRFGTPTGRVLITHPAPVSGGPPIDDPPDSDPPPFSPAPPFTSTSTWADARRTGAWQRRRLGRRADGQVRRRGTDVRRRRPGVPRRAGVPGDRRRAEALPAPGWRAAWRAAPPADGEDLS